jgi:hypothetical protein
VDNEGDGRLGGETLDRLQLHHFVAHRFDDTPAAGEGAEEIGDRVERDGLERSEHYRRDNRRDRVGVVVKLVDLFECQRSQHHEQEQRHGDGALRVLADDLDDDVAGVAAAVHGLFRHLRKSFKE